MPRRMYLTASGPPIPSPGHVSGRWDDTVGKAAVALSDSKAGTNTIVSRAETSTSGTYDVCLIQAISPAFQRSAVLTGTYQTMVAFQESSSDADFVRGTSIWVVQADGTTQRGVLISANGSTELPTAMSGVSATGTLSDLTVQAGDRLVLELGFRTVNTSGTSFTGSLRYGGTDATDLAANATGVTTRSPWIEFADDAFVTLFTPVAVESNGFFLSYS